MRVFGSRFGGTTKFQQVGGECRKNHARVDCSFEPTLVLLRGLELEDLAPLVPRYSLSSGGSERGLDVAVNGLEGGLSSSMLVPVALRRLDFVGD